MAKYSYSFFFFFSLGQVVKTSCSDAPVMFVLCPGANPIPRLIKLSGQSGIEGKVLIISLGQGQEQVTI